MTPLKASSGRDITKTAPRSGRSATTTAAADRLGLKLKGINSYISMIKIF